MPVNRRSTYVRFGAEYGNSPDLAQRFAAQNDRWWVKVDDTVESSAQPVIHQTFLEYIGPWPEVCGAPGAYEPDYILPPYLYQAYLVENVRKAKEENDHELTQAYVQLLHDVSLAGVSG